MPLHEISPGRERSEEHAYVEFTSSVTVNATAEATPNDVVSAGAIMFDGTTKVVIEFYSYSITTGATSGSYVVLNLWDASTDLGRIGAVKTPAAVAIETPVRLARILTPSNGSHTYRVRAWRISSDGSVSANTGGAGTAMPGYIRITTA